MNKIRVALMTAALLSGIGCVSNSGPKWQGTGGVIKRTQATVIVDGKPTQVRVICSRGCEEP